MTLSRDENQGRCERALPASEFASEEPVHLVISAIDAGISLVRVEFNSEFDSDECIFSGFLTALSYIGDMMFPQPFDRMTFGQYTMILRVEAPFLFCYVFSGSTVQASRRLYDFINVLQEKASLLNSLKNTIAFGIVDKAAKSSIKELATRIFGGPR